MTFKKIKSTLTCTKCQIVKTFDADAEIYAVNLKDSKELQVWENENCTAILFEGLCPDCKYNKAA